MGWQTMTFTPRPIVYFKIVGTFNTANEVFHCVHFECPAQLGSEHRPRLHGFDVSNPSTPAQRSTQAAQPPDRTSAQGSAQGGQLPDGLPGQNSGQGSQLAVVAAP